MMKNIGIITHNFPENSNDRQNAGIFVFDVAQRISNFAKVAVYSPSISQKNKKLGKLHLLNFPVLTGNKLGNFKIWNPLDYLRFVYFFISGIYYLPQFINKYHIKVNIVMWSFPSGVFAYLAKKIYGVPYVTWCLGSDIYIFAKKPIFKFIIKNILKNSDFVFADGIDLSMETKKLSGIECHFIPSANDANYKNGTKYTERKNINITFVGRLELVKGPDILLQALINIKDEISKFKIDIIGDGSLMKELTEKVKKNNLIDCITFHGNLNNFQEISDIVKRADWLVIPSRSDSIPLVFSESMKCGTPIIASSLPDLDYLINKYDVGLSFKKNDFVDLSSIIIKLPKYRDKRMFFSKNTKKAVKDFSVNKSANRILSYINKI